jgi:hypothetical protein
MKFQNPSQKQYNCSILEYYVNIGQLLEKKVKWKTKINYAETLSWIKVSIWLLTL